MTVSNKPGHRGEREVSRKPLRGECRLNPSEPVVTRLVCFVLFRTRDCGCSERPAFPAPSEFQKAGRSWQTSRGNMRRDRGPMLVVIARSEATKQSILLARRDGLLRFARNDECWRIGNELTLVVPDKRAK